MSTSEVDGVSGEKSQPPPLEQKKLDPAAELAERVLSTHTEEGVVTENPLSKKTLENLSEKHLGTLEKIDKSRSSSLSRRQQIGSSQEGQKIQTSPYRETLLSQKVTLLKGIGATAVSLSSNALHAILLRIKMDPSMIGASAPKVMAGMGLAIGSAVTLVSLQEIGVALGDTVMQLRKLRNEGHATPKEVAKVLFRPFLPDRPLLKDIVSLALGILTLTKTIGASTHSLPPAVLASLGAAAAVLGIALGALIAILGGFITVIGVKDAIQAGRKLYHVHKEIKAFNENKPDTANNIIDFLKETRLQTTSRIQQKELTKSILKACLGTFITAVGVLGIAAVFTMGWTAIGIVIAGTVLGVIATGVAIGGVIYQKKTEKKINDSVDTKLNSMVTELEDSKQWKTIVAMLVEDGFIAKEFKMSETTSPHDSAEILKKLETCSTNEKKDLLRKYCLSPKPLEKITPIIVVATATGAAK